MGANRMPTRKSVGNTVLGVRIGCHAFKRCCRNAVSAVVVKGDEYSTVPSLFVGILRRTCRLPPRASGSLAVGAILFALSPEHVVVLRAATGEEGRGGSDEAGFGVSAYSCLPRHTQSSALHHDF